jgi:hypothetical protein
MAQNGTGLNFISNGVGSCMNYYFGDPLLVGVVFLLFFVAFLFLQGTRNDFKLVMIVPITILALMWIPWLYVFLLLIGAYVMYRVVMYKVSG